MSDQVKFLSWTDGDVIPALISVCALQWIIDDKKLEYYWNPYFTNTELKWLFSVHTTARHTYEASRAF